MREINDHFEKVFFTESFLGAGAFHGSTLTIPVRNFFVLTGHPLETEGGGPFEGEIVFIGVSSSKRAVIEYIGDTKDPTGFKSERVESDDVPDAVPDADSTREFGFEGLQIDLKLWVDWVVRARAFILRVGS